MGISWLVKRAVYIVTSTWLKNCPPDEGGELSENSRRVNVAYIYLNSVRQSQKLLFSVFVRGKERPGLRDFFRAYRPP